MLRIGKRYFSWNSVKFRLAGVGSEKITKIGFSEKLTDELIRGNRRDGTPLGVSSGSYDGGMMTVSFLLDEWFGSGPLQPGYLSVLTLLKTVGLADVECDAQLQFFEEAGPASGGIIAVPGVVTIYAPVIRPLEPKIDTAVGVTGTEVEVGFRVIEPLQGNGAQLASVVRSFSGL